MRTYDQIGVGYSRHRRPDQRLVDAIVAQLGLYPGATVADIGAGSGNYSVALADRGFRMKAVEPSNVMRRQAPHHPGVQWFPGVAQAVPLESGSVAGVVCILAFHHFCSARQAALEMIRISSGPIVTFTYDPRAAENFWLKDYFPEIFTGASSIFPPLGQVCELFDDAGLSSTTDVFNLPHDLQDMFLAAAWRRPHLYLDPEVRSCMSAFALADGNWVQSRIQRLQADLASGAWHERYGSLLGTQEYDAGYRFVCARRAT